MRPHSWWPGRRVAPLLTAVAFALSAGLGAEAGAWERCGPRICGGQDRCCNASCGICAPPGGYLPEATPVQELVSCQRSNVSQGVARRTQFIGT